MHHREVINVTANGTVKNFVSGLPTQPEIDILLVVKGKRCFKQDLVAPESSKHFIFCPFIFKTTIGYLSQAWKEWSDCGLLQ